MRTRRRAARPGALVVTAVNLIFLVLTQVAPSASQKLYAVPYSDDDVLIIDPETDTVSYEPSGATGKIKWQGLSLGINSKMYGSPSGLSEKRVLVIDPLQNNKISFLSTGGATPGTWSDMVTAANGKMYSPPTQGNQILVIDSNTDKVSFIVDSTGGRWIGIAVGNNGNLYAPPVMGVKVLVIHPSTDTLSYIPVNAPNIPGFPHNFWGGITAASNGKLYSTACMATELLVIDEANKPPYYMAVTVKKTGLCQWTGLTKAPNGKLYAAPCDAQSVLVIDPATDSVDYIPVAHPNGVPYRTGNEKWGDIMVAHYNGMMYVSPMKAEDILIIDPGTHKLSFINIPNRSALSKWSGLAQLPPLPTVSPTLRPSVPPTLGPSSSPSTQPSLSSMTPTYSPSVAPSYLPTVSPTVHPSTPPYTPTTTPYTPTTTPHTATTTPTPHPSSTSSSPSTSPTMQPRQVAPSLYPSWGIPSVSPVGSMASVSPTGSGNATHTPTSTVGPSVSPTQPPPGPTPTVTFVDSVSSTSTMHSTMATLSHTIYLPPDAPTAPPPNIPMVDAASGLATGGGLFQAGGAGAVSTAAFLDCSLPPSGRKLLFSLHPSQLRPWGDEDVGCIMGGVFLTVGVWAVSWALSGALHLLGLKFHRFWRHPNTAVSMLCFVYQGMVVAAWRLLLSAPDSSRRAVGGLTAALLAGVPFFAWRIVNIGLLDPPHALIREWREPRPHPRVLLYLLSEIGDWVGTREESYWLDRWQCLVRDYNTCNAARGMTLELGVVYALGAVVCIDAGTPQRCGFVRVTACCIHLAKVTLLWRWSPFRCRRDSYLTRGLHLLMASALGVSATHAYFGGAGSYSRFELVLLMAATGVYNIQVLLFLAGEVLLWFKGYRAELQEAESQRAWQSGLLKSADETMRSVNTHEIDILTAGLSPSKLPLGGVLAEDTRSPGEWGAQVVLGSEMKPRQGTAEGTAEGGEGDTSAILGASFAGASLLESPPGGDRHVESTLHPPKRLRSSKRRTAKPSFATVLGSMEGDNTPAATAGATGHTSAASKPLTPELSCARVDSALLSSPSTAVASVSLTPSLTSTPDDKRVSKQLSGGLERSRRVGLLTPHVECPISLPQNPAKKRASPNGRSRAQTVVKPYTPTEGLMRGQTLVELPPPGEEDETPTSADVSLHAATVGRKRRGRRLKESGTRAEMGARGSLPRISSTTQIQQRHSPSGPNQWEGGVPSPLRSSGSLLKLTSLRRHRVPKAADL
eukprot:Hpha_TRINITY_DN8102_c0_g1::TRINITY_DN8102_c0_g1_i1::g.172028::m.172028